MSTGKGIAIAGTAASGAAVAIFSGEPMVIFPVCFFTFLIAILGG